MTQKELWREKVSLIRKLFHGREDVYGTTVYRIEDGLRKKSCHPFRKNEANVPLTDEAVYRHIKAETNGSEIMMYLLVNGRIKFAAADYDSGDPKADAVRTAQLSLKLGFPCHVAPSSTKGYHVYWFFDDWIPADAATEFIRYLHSECGYFQRTGQRVPEIYPKQSTITPGTYGNGICIPLCEPPMKVGRKCFADPATGEPLPFEKQWEYAFAIKPIDSKWFLGKLDELKIDYKNVEQIQAGQKPRGNTSREYDGTPRYDRPYTKPTTGDFNLVIEKCPAIAKLWEKDQEGNYVYSSDLPSGHPNNISNDARSRATWIAIHTKNGEEIIRKRWGDPERLKTLDYAKEVNYMPPTCANMQAAGVCIKGIHPKSPCKTFCLNKKPPKVTENGVTKVNPENLPEAQWPEPSPVRFATMGSKLTAEEIITELKEAVEAPEKPSDFDDVINSAIMSASHLPEKERKPVDDYIVGQKVMGKAELKRQLKEAKTERNNQAAQERLSGNPTYTFDGVTYCIRDGRYWAQRRNAKGELQETELTSFLIEMRYDITEMSSIDEDSDEDDRSIRKRIFEGDIVVGKERKPFRVADEEWLRSSEQFFSLITRHGGFDLQFYRHNFDHIRNAVGYFGRLTSKKKIRVTDVGHHKVDGKWKYLMRSAIVTREGVFPNDEFDVGYNNEMDRQLDFVVTDKDELKEVARHVLSDYFDCCNRKAAMITFAHAMAATTMPFMPISKRPILWLHGDSGGGKSFLLESAQCFFGNFKIFRNEQTSEGSKMEAATGFRHCLLMVDDYKKTLKNNETAFYSFLQAVYDGSVATKLNRDGSQRNRVARARGLLCFSGEEFPSQEESNVARMILVDAGKKKDKEKGESVLQNKHRYSAVTSHFIHYLYNVPEYYIKDTFRKYCEFFERDIKDAYDNALRIAQNLAYNMTAFKLAMEMFVMNGVIDETARDQLLVEHEKNLLNTRSSITHKMSGTRAVSQFLSYLREMLVDQNRYFIEDLPGYQAGDNRAARPLGFWKSETPDVAYLYPLTTYGEVKQMADRHKKVIHDIAYVERQLYTDGHLDADASDPGSWRGTKQVRKKDGKRPRVWTIKLSSLGIDLPSVPDTNPKSNLPDDNPF